MQRSPRAVVIRRRIRWGSALLCLFAAYRLFRFGVTAENQVATAGSLMAMFALIIVATLLFLPESLPFLSRPFTVFIDGLYGTGPGKGKPPYDCRLARGYVKQERYEDAVDEYARVMHFHPKEKEPYRESILLLVQRFEDREAAEEVLNRGLRKIGSKAERRELQKLFDDAVKRL